MKTQTLLSFFVLFAILVFCIKTESEIDNVVELTEENFDTQVDENEKWFIKFYTDWCGHCKHLKPIFSKLADSETKVHFGGVNCEKQKKLCKKYRIRGYPTLKFLTRSQVWDYPGAPTEKSMKAFCDTMSRPAMLPMKRSELKKITKPTESPESYIIVLYPETDDPTDEKNELYQGIQQIADKYRGVSNFHYLAINEVKGIYENFVDLVSESGPIVISIRDPNYSPSYFKLSDAAGETSLEEWIESNLLPLLPEFNRDTFTKITRIEKLIALAVIDPDNEEANDYLEIVKKVSSQENRLVFAWINGVEFKNYVSQFGVNQKNLQQVVVIDFKNEKHFHLPQEEDQEEAETLSEQEKITKLIDGVFSGVIKPQGKGSGILGMIMHVFNQIPNLAKEQPIFASIFVVLLIVLIVSLFWPGTKETVENTEKEEKEGKERKEEKDKNEAGEDKTEKDDKEEKKKEK
ncbi:protein disulfide-isomerase tmx3 [Anaeramoeba flamelloides]|uniref:Protein disulfide-isomerase tmx3 n=1 Tax=Anaeramoeba flamelloides TaxID=1746091 RepID=A0AAV7ZHH6_9EUKA|nr:protein disulfide-isomerase tmx3 [Anaeramoeba flamelloides]